MTPGRLTHVGIWSKKLFLAQWILSDIALAVFPGNLFLFEGLWTSSRAAALFSQKIRTKAGGPNVGRSHDCVFIPERAVHRLRLSRLVF